MGDAATDEIMDGWKEGYEFLADLLIGLEDNLKKEHSSMDGKSCSNASISSKASNSSGQSYKGSIILNLKL